MPCPVTHTRINGEKAEAEFKAPGEGTDGDYIRWDAPGVEVEQPKEKETIQAVSDQFNRFQMYNFNEHMHCLRGTHLKTQGVRDPSLGFSRF